MGATGGTAGGGRRHAARVLIGPWVVREIRSRHRQSSIDLGWAVVTPILTVMGYGLVLTRFFGVTGDGVPYLSFAWSGLAVWTFVAGGLMAGAWSFVNAADLVRKVAFPRVLVPVVAVAGAGVDLLVALVLLVVLIVVQGIGVSPSVVMALPVLAVVAVWTAGVGTLLATLTAYSRDFAMAAAAVLRVGVFVTPVMYPPSEIPPQYEWLELINPVAVFIAAFRDAVLYGEWPQWAPLAAHSCGAVLMVAIGMATLRRVEGRLADVV